MRRKDREVTDIHEIASILEKCDTMSLALQDEEYPYVVPVSFGYEVKDDQIILYFHGAKEGHKVDLISRNNKVCIEAHYMLHTERTAYGITARYGSVIGRGKAEVVEGDEALKALKTIVDHYHYEDFLVAMCKSLPVTRVYKICLESVSGKKNHE